MKMGLLCSGLFWGTVVILMGLSIILNAVFGIHIPLFRIIFALILIYIGIKILTGGSCWRNDRMNACFNEKTVCSSSVKDNDYSIVFGKANYDLSAISLEGKSINASVNVVFGEAKVKVNTNMPVRIVAGSAFGEAVLPNGNTVAFGKSIYESPSFKEGSPALNIKADVAFGSLKISDR